MVGWMGVIGIDDQLLHDDFRIHHHHLQRMLTWGSDVEIDAQPAEVVEDLATHVLPESREVDVAGWAWEWFQHL